MIRAAALAVLAASAAASQTPDPHTATFKAGTRLVEVEVVVRNKTGPVTGLKKEDFTILDQGKPQRIDVFREGRATAPTTTIPLPPDAVSNRVTTLGKAVSSVAGYTAVFYDQLNTRLDLEEYERNALVKFLRSLGSQEHVAVYILGRDLHVLQDFADDPAKLIAALQHLDSGRDLMPANVHDAMFGFETDMLGNIIYLSAMGPAARAMIDRSVGESAANVAQVNGIRNGLTTGEALQVIGRHLGGMPGRRNLIWMMEKPETALPFVGMLRQFNIALYIALAHSLEFDPSGRFMGDAGNVRQALNPGEGVPLATLMPDVMDTQRRARQYAELTGGAGFGDAQDIALAVKTAEDDSRSAYTLGYYPPEEVLDGKFHAIAVKVAGKKKSDLEIRYRPGYLATKQPASAPPQTAVADILNNALDDTGLEIIAQVDRDSAPGLYRVRLTLDLHELQLIREGGHSKVSIELGFLTGTSVNVRTLAIDLTDAQLAAALRDGYHLRASGVPATGDSIRVMARDPSTGVAGSLTIRVPPAAAAQNR